MTTTLAQLFVAFLAVYAFGLLCGWVLGLSAGRRIYRREMRRAIDRNRSLDNTLTFTRGGKTS